MNHVVLIGRLTRDPELRYIAGTGTPVANFAIAVDREFSGKDGKRETDFIDIQVWGKSAENCANYIGKGSLVAIQGSLRIDSYQNQAGETPNFEPSFEPTGLDPQGFQAIDDDDIPF